MKISEELIWFSIAKTVSVWAKIVTNNRTIQTLEDPIQALKGDYLCNGIDNEQWAIKKEDQDRCKTHFIKIFETREIFQPELS